MRKHFLVLMLMALLPLAGWAQTATFGDVAVGKYTYGDATLPVPVVKDSEGAILTESTHYTVSEDAYDKTTNLAVNKEDMKGEQELYLKITGVGAYVGQEKNVYFTVQKKNLTVSVTTSFERAYLAATEPTINASSEITLAGLVTADPWSDDAADLGTLDYTYAGKGNKDYPGGTYPITFSGYTSDCYNIIYPESSFTITGTDISGETVSVKDGTAFADKTYKGAAYTADELTGLVLTYGEKELVQGTDFNIVAGSGDWKTVGTHSYTVNFIGNYSGTKSDFASFSIVQAPLSVDVDDIKVTYTGTAFTDQASIGVTPSFKYYGFVGEDVATKATLISGFTAPTVAVTQDGGATYVNDGGYGLTISGGSTPDDSNYKIVNRLNTGKLIINKKDVALTANDASKGPADEDPAFTLATYTLGDGDVLDASTVSFTRAPGNAVGESYEITPDVTSIKVKKSGTDVTANYNLTAGTPKGKLSITKATLTVTILDQNKIYGDDDPEEIANPVEGTNYIVSGLVAGDEITSVTLIKSWDAEAVGNYILTGEVVYTGAEHYETFTVVPGNFEITKAPLTVTLPIKNVEAGKNAAEALAALTKDGIEITGFKNEEVVADAFNLSLKSGLSVDDESKLVDQADDEGYILTLTDAIWANYAIDDERTIAGKLIVGTGNTAVLSLDANSNQFTAITTANGETRDVNITLRREQTIGGVARTWTKGIWNCMVLPFDAKPRQISNALGYAIINVVNPAETTEGNVKFKLEMIETIPANTPFFVKGDVDLVDGYVAEFKEVKIVAPETAYPSVKASSDEIGYNFVGAYDKYTITGDDMEHLRFRLGSENSWNKIGNGSSAEWNIVPFNAYMDLGKAAAAREIIFTFEELDGSTTAIRSIDVDKVNSTSAKAEGWYNLNGVKMNGAPTQKGVYIQNGKKVVVK